MKTYIKLLTALVTACVIFSCGNAANDVNFNPNFGELGQGKEVDACLDLGDNVLVPSIQDQFTTLPGRVSVFFKVSDNEGNPVPGLKPENFTIYEQGRNDDCFNVISASESKKRIVSNSQVFSNTTLLVLDLSNSVLSSSLDQLKTASESFINNVFNSNSDAQMTSPESFKMAIYWFDGENELHLLNALTSEKQELIAAIQGITADISNDPSTDLYGAVIKSTDIASDLLNASTQGDKIGAASIVIFTDGTDQASRYTRSAAQQKVDTANPNISFFTIGLRGEIDTEVLEDIGKTFSVFAENKEELESTFNDISVRISERASSFYLFEYCSPKRNGSGENNLAIQVKQGSRQGAVQTRFNATGFTAGCE